MRFCVLVDTSKIKIALQNLCCAAAIVCDFFKQVTQIFYTQCYADIDRNILTVFLLHFTRCSLCNPVIMVQWERTWIVFDITEQVHL